MRYLIALLLTGVSLFGAAGDVLWANVQSNGWIMEIQFSGMATNGTFDFNLKTNGTGPGRVVLTVTSPGYDSTGTSNTVTRTVIGTKQLRFPYPNEGANYVTNDIISTNAHALIALSDFIYKQDTVTVCNIAANLYSTNNANATTTFTNNSLINVKDAKTLGNWSYPGRQLVGSSFVLRAVAFQRHGKNKSPVAHVKFIVTDGSTTTTNTANSLYVDQTMPDAVPIPEYQATISTTSFTDGSLLRCDFQAFPWIGTNALSTADGVYPNEDTPFYGPITNLLNRAGAVTVLSAVVATNGNDGTGFATNAFNSASPPNAFATITAAADAVIKPAGGSSGFTTNEGVIYLRQGPHHWTDNNAITCLPKSWTVVTNFPGDSNVVVSNTATTFSNFGDGGAYGRIKLSGNITLRGANSTFYNVKYFWCDRITINEAVDPLWDTDTGTHMYYATGCDVTAMGQGFKGFGSSTLAWKLIRGNFNRSSSDWQMYTVLGNYSTNNSPFGLGTTLANLPFYEDGLIVGFNRFQNLGYAGFTFAPIFTGTQSGTNGLVWVNNLLEGTKTNLPGALFALFPDGSTGASTNAIIWNNTFVGERENIAYNDIGSSPVPRMLWSMKNNLFNDFNIKSDTFAGNSQDGGRTGNWPVLWGVGSSGNANWEQTDTGGGGQFLAVFLGVNSYQPTITGGDPPNGTANARTYPQFVFDGSSTTTIAGAGNGDYRLLSSSPFGFNGWVNETLFPSDIEGQGRGGFDAPGAFVGASPRKGSQ